MHPWRGRSRPPHSDIPVKDPEAALADRHPQLVACESFLRKPVKAFDPIKGEGELPDPSPWGNAFRDFVARLPAFEPFAELAEERARSGLVWHVEHSRGEIRSIVLAEQLFAQRIGMQPVSREHEATLIERCSGGARSSADLVRGRVSDEVFAALTDPAEGLFPQPEEIELECSCGAKHAMCEHIATALYGTGYRIDERPKVFFTIRGTNPEVLKGILPAGLSRAPVPSEQCVPEENLAEVFDFRLDRPEVTEMVGEDEGGEDQLEVLFNRPPPADAEGFEVETAERSTAPAEQGSWLDDDWDDDPDEDSDDMDAEVFGGPGPSPIQIASGEEGEDVLEIGRADLLELGIPSHRIQRMLSDGVLLKTPRRGKYQLTPEAWAEIEPLLAE